MTNKPTDKSSENLLEQKIKKQMNSNAKKTSFGGGIDVDLNKVYVSKQQADRSTKVLKEIVAKKPKP